MVSQIYAGKSDGWYSLKDGTKIGSGAVDNNKLPLLGFNIIKSSNAYTNGTNENTATSTARLVSDYGNFDYGKVFYTGFVPSAWDTGFEGIGPFNHVAVMFSWTLGQISSGSKDSILTSYAQSVPAGKHAMLGWNEADYKIIDGTISSYTAYKADMDHMYDLFESLTLTGQVEVWDCFGQYNIDPASGPRFNNAWTNPAKRHGLIWDCYWNDATKDTSGATKVATITDKNAQLGITRWMVGEFGDRRQEDSFTPSANLGQTKETSDSHRATLLTNRLNAFATASVPPEGICYFDVIGTSGDHRIYLGNGSGGPDTATQTVWKNAMAAAQAG